MQRLYLGLDLLAVGAFIAIGRDTHERSGTFGAFVETAAPFLIALGVGWVVMRAWRSPRSLGVGAGVAGTTVVLGMVLRKVVFGDGTAIAFVVVATIFLGAFIVGWRLVASRFGPAATG